MRHCIGGSCIDSDLCDVTCGAIHTPGYASRTAGIGPNCPRISGTVTDFFAQSRIPDSVIIVPELEELRAVVSSLRGLF